MREFKLNPNYNDSELFKHFGQYARFIFGEYVIDFNKKIMSSDNPSDLFKKVKDEYEDYKKRVKK